MILVTGGAGFIGSNLVAALLGRGATVAVCDHLGGEKWRNLRKHKVAEVVEPDQLLGWLGRHDLPFEAIFHLGAITDTAERDAEKLMRVNVELPMAIWRHCAKVGTPLYYASSAAVYGDGSRGFADGCEDRVSKRYKPLNPYGMSKWAFDRLAVGEIARGEPAPPSWVGFRFFNVYGPNEYHKGAMQSAIAKNYRALARGGAMRLFRSANPDYRDGEQLRDFVYVEDCVAVMLWAMDRRPPNDIYNVGSGRPRTWLDLAAAMFAAIGLPPKIEFVDLPKEIRRGYQYRTCADLERLRGAGYRAPFTELEAGVGDYIGRYLSASDPYR